MHYEENLLWVERNYQVKFNRVISLEAKQKLLQWNSLETIICSALYLMIQSAGKGCACIWRLYDAKKKFKRGT